MPNPYVSEQIKQPELFAERKARLVKLLGLNAPLVMIADECLLVAQAYRGGKWALARHVTMLALLEFWRFRIAGPVMIPIYRFLCRRDIWHMEQGPNGFGCPFCGKGEIADSECCDEEPVNEL